MGKMWSPKIEERVIQIFDRLKQDQPLAKYVDGSLQIPKPYRGVADIKLIVLGQDPTVKDADDRKDINTVLNLDKNGSVRSYLAGVCNSLGIDLKENVYATNIYKNFFIRPPTQIEDVNIFQEFAPLWLPLLIDELEEFGRVPAVTLGEPILAPLVGKEVPARVGHYWGYVPDWKSHALDPFQHIKPRENILERIVFPFPHQPSLRKQFYRINMNDYLVYVKTTAFP